MNLVRANSPVLQFEAGAGNTMANGWLKTFLSGTTTPVQTYRNKAGDLNPSEIQLNYRGEADVWLDDEKEYRFELWDVTKTRLIWRRDNVTATGTSSYGAKDIVYFDIESIDNPPPGLYLSIQTAITNGKIPVIRYDGALYYFDKEYLEDDSPAYSFAGRLDSDEWKTAIRVTSEGVTLGNVLGVNGTVAKGVHNSFPLGGGKCGAESGDPDYPYLMFDNDVYAVEAEFNGSYGIGYVADGASPVTVKYDGATVTVNPDEPALLMVTYVRVVNAGNPSGFVMIEKAGKTITAGQVLFLYDETSDGVIEIGGYYLLVLGLATVKSDGEIDGSGTHAGLLNRYFYSVHGGFWKKTNDIFTVQNGLANGPDSLATGKQTSTALNNGKAAGALSLANGQDALAAGNYSVALHANGIAEKHAMSCGNDAMALHLGSKVLADGGVSGRNYQTVLGYNNELDNESAVVVGWDGKNISKMDTDGNIFTGKRLDLTNNVMPLFKLPDSDPASPGTEPVTGYWICDSKKQLVTAAEIVALHAMGMKFVLCESTEPARNSRMYVEQKSVITDSTIDIEFVSAADTMIMKIVVQKETTAQVTDASLFITSTTITPVERAWTRQPETVTEGANTYAAVVDGKLTLDVSHSIANVHLKDSNMSGHPVFTINVQTGASGEISDNIVYVVNTCSSGLDVAVKCDNQSHFARGSVSINANRGAYVNINPMYFEVVDAGPVSP